MSLITTSLDTLITRDPCLAEAMYRGAAADETYKGFVDAKDGSVSKYPDRVVTHNIAGLGTWQQKNEGGVIAMDTPGPADTKETVYSRFGLGVEFTEDFSDDVMYGVQEEVIEDIGRTHSLTHNIQVGQIYDNAFNTTLYTSGDGKAICAPDHTAYMGGPARANAPTIAVEPSYEGIQTLLTLLMRQTDDRGNPRPAVNIGQGLDVLISPDKFFDVSRILNAGSSYEPNSNHNAINVLNTNFRFNIKVNPYFTSTSNWFLADQSEKGIWHVTKQGLIRDMYNNDRTKGAIWDGRGRWAYHIKTWEKLAGSNA